MTITIGAAASILFLTLGFFLLLVLFSAAEKNQPVLHPNETFISARGTQPWWAVATSIYAGGMGTGLLFAVPETAVLTGWFGVLGYALSYAFPYWIMSFCAAWVRKSLKSEGFALCDFVFMRFGRISQIIVAALSLFFLWIFLTVELTSIGSVFALVCPEFPPAVATVSVAAVTLGYTLIAGLPASLLTDRIQGVSLFFLAIFAVICILVEVAPSIDGESWRSAAFWNVDGLIAAFILLISVTLNEILNEGAWQRVFAAKSAKDARIGLQVSGLFLIITVIFYGALGIVANAASFAGVIELPEGYEYEAFFRLLVTMGELFIGITTFLALALVCSTADSLQNGMVAVLGRFFLENNISFNWARMFVFLVNIPAIIVASFELSIVQLFMVSNILAAAVVPGVLLGFWYRTTWIGFLSGCVLGLLVIPMTGWIVLGTFVGGLQWVLFPLGPFHYTTLITFVAVPTTSSIVTICASALHGKADPAVIDRRKEMHKMMTSTSTSETCVTVETSAVQLESVEDSGTKSERDSET